MRAVFLILITVILSPWSSSAEVLSLSEDRVIDLEFSPPQGDRPTFLMLPGVNRGLKIDEPAAQALIRRGFGVATFNFSLQPASLSHLPENLRPYFDSAPVTLADLAEETEKVADHLRSRQPNSRLIPVTLSYSGALAPLLHSFTDLVDAVPLTSMAAFSPQLEAYRNWLLAGQLFNPILGPALTRQWLDAAYRFQWEAQVTALSGSPGFPQARHRDMVEGYVHMSRATEGYFWKDSVGAHHDFILAAGENPSLLRHQVRVITERLAKGRPERVFVVARSGHIVPADQPETYARILESIQSERPSQGSIILVDPESESWRELDVIEGIGYLKKLLPSDRGLPNTEAKPPKKPIPGSF